MRARIDISEVEASTKIRAKYLRALENEEWDLLPGPTYVKSFLRTYAESLDLDAKLLVDEYKLRHERLSEVELQPINAAAPGRERRRQGPLVPRWVTIAAIFAALIVTLSLLGGDDPDETRRAAAARDDDDRARGDPAAAAGGAQARAPADRRDRRGQRLPEGRRSHARQRRDADGGLAHEDVSLAALSPDARQQRRAPGHQRPLALGRRRRRSRSASRSRRTADRRPLSAAKRPICSP